MLILFILALVFFNNLLPSFNCFFFYNTGHTMSCALEPTRRISGGPEPPQGEKGNRTMDNGLSLVIGFVSLRVQ